MAIHDDRTFYLEGTVPELEHGCFTCQLHTPDDAPVAPIPHFRSPRRLLGWSPVLAAMPADMGPGAGRRTVERSAFVMRAVDVRLSSAEEATFFVTKRFVAAFRPGDTIRMVYNNNADLGMAAYRDGELIAAVGALTVLQLRSEIVVTMPWDLVERAEAPFFERDPTLRRTLALGSELVVCPYQMRLGEQTLIVATGFRSLGPYDVGLVKPAVRGFEGSGAKGYIVRRGVVRDATARDTAAMLVRGVKVSGHRPIEPRVFFADDPDDSPDGEE